MAKALKKKPLLDFLQLYMTHFDIDEDTEEMKPEAQTIKKIIDVVKNGKFDAEDSEMFRTIQEDVKNEVIQIAKEDYNFDGDLAEKGMHPITDSFCKKIKQIDKL